MPFTHQFKPTHKEIKTYYEELARYATHEVTNEGATSTAFQNLLAATCKKADWHLVPQLVTKIKGKNVRPDGTLRDEYYLHHGYWEAKDSSDKLDVEIRKKIALATRSPTRSSRPRPFSTKTARRPSRASISPTPSSFATCSILFTTIPFPKLKASS